MDRSHPDEPSESPHDRGNELSSGCPWLNKKKSNPILAPALDESVNPRNQMPEFPQSQAEGQKATLSTRRVMSSIPKTGTDNQKWEYPSPQQFFHALLRRNKTAEEETMEAVVYVHNAVNEESWEQILEYESLHKEVCLEPSLQRFVGNSEKISPKAWLMQKVTGQELFDRHDWIVDRCGAKAVRYIIDYYDTTNTSAADGKFNVRIDARPALDDIGNVWDRLRFPIVKKFRDWIRPVPPSGEPPASTATGYVAG